MTHKRRLATIAVLASALIASVLVAFVLISGRDGSVERPAARAASSSAPSDGRFSAVLVDGRELTLADLRGKPTVVGFVIEDCATCIPTLQTLATLSGDGDVNAIALNLNTPTAASAPRAARRLATFADAVEAKGPVFAADPGTRTASAFGIRQLESFLIFDASGRELGRGVGLGADEIRQTLEGA
ncbi:MAG: TlpA family protein disulfide reductase [Gaiellaceae bacterium]